MVGACVGFSVVGASAGCSVGASVGIGVGASVDIGFVVGASVWLLEHLVGIGVRASVGTNNK